MGAPPLGSPSAANLLEAAFAAFRAGEIERARALCEAGLRASPKHPDGLLLRGILRHMAGQPQRALQDVERAIAVRPHDPFAHFTLGQMRLDAGKHAIAATAFRRALELDANFAPAWVTLGIALRATGKPAAALDAYDRALALLPNDPNVAYNRANALLELDRIDDAIVGYRRAVALAPDHVDAWRALGDLLERALDHAGAAEALERRRMLQPDAPGIDAALGRVYAAGERYEAALAALERAVPRAPDDAALQLALAHVKATGLGLVDEAVLHAEQAAALEPSSLHASALLFAQNYVPSLSADALFERHLAWQRQFEAPQVPRTLPARSREPDRRLRVGFVSADLYLHPVALFLLPLVRSLDRRRLEVTCYYVGNRRRDGLTAELERDADRWRAIDQPSAAIEPIIADDIDILVDLGGHTRGDLLEIFAHKPAPVQVSWLGYPNTTGLSRMDYRLTDAIVDPPGPADRLSTERLIRLPHGFHCYVPREAAPAPGPAPARAAGCVTFGSLNALAKLSDDAVAGWAAVLRAVPARLLIQRRGLAAAPARAAVRARFAAHGIAGDRLLLQPGDGGGPFEAYRQIDIALDTFPYNGTTTTCEALWMGVPVVTWLGDRHAARVSASLLTRIGQTDLIGGSPADFVAIAAALAADLERLGTLRATLRDRMMASPLCDPVGFARDVEAALRAIWVEWCTGPE